MLPVALHIEILKPVPFQEISIEVQAVREGRKLQVLRGILTADGTARAIATLVRLRDAPQIHPLPEQVAVMSAAEYQGPEGLPSCRHASPFFQLVECRRLHGGFEQLGRGVAWMRLRGQIIAGESPSAFAAVVLCADAAGGLGAVVPRSSWNYPNVTLSVHLERPPEGDWVLLDSQMLNQGRGVAQASGVVADLTGRVGSIQQALILEPAMPA